MTISYNWLKEYLPLDISAERAGEILTDIGLEVESIKKVDSVKGGLEGVVVGEVVSCVKHPNADRLSVTEVNIGQEEKLQIVCGAPNVAVGQKVPVATVGTTLYANDEAFQIKKGKIRGEVSNGMICAEDELGLGSGHDGIMVLDSNAKPGLAAKDYFKIETDYVIEIGLTPNRTDAMGHYGVARDLRAGLIQQGISTELSLPKFDFKIDNTNRTIPLEVENIEACPQYLGITISNVKVADSPSWLQNKLKAIGLKPINNIVDTTNFVLHELGHPLHAFDADKIAGGKVIVKNLSSGAAFTTLDNVERKLHEDDLMICNANGGMCIAGVFGGAHSGVTNSTKNVFLEGAWFNPVTIRKAAKRHGLNTDASYRYERGVDPNVTKFALQRAAILIKELAGGEISSGIQESISTEFPKGKVELDLDRLNMLIGNDIDPVKVLEILESLEIEVISKNGKLWALEIPTYRVDVTREADVIEEVLRIYGFNNVELPERMHISISEEEPFRITKIKKAASAFLTGNGYSEIMNNSLTKESYYQKFSKDETNSLVQILNPLSQDLGVMRQTLVFGALEVVSHNLNRQTGDVKIFEFGKSYFKKGDGEYDEPEQLLVALSGKDLPEGWNEKQQEASFFHLKGIVSALLERFGISDCQEQIVNDSFFNEALVFARGDKEFLRMGEVKSEIQSSFDIDQPVFIGVFNLDYINKATRRKKIEVEDLSRFPWVRRDLALLVDVEVQYGSLLAASKKAGGKLLKGVNLFDVYTGKNLPEGKKSYALSFILQDDQQTLVDKKVDAIMNKIVATLTKQFGAELR